MIARLSELFRAIAPRDLQDKPLYLLNTAIVPSDRRLDAGTLGVAGPALDLAFADHLIALGEWCGRGPAVVLNVPEIEAHAHAVAEYNKAEAAAVVRHQLLGVAMHELAHVLAQPVDLHDDTPATPRGASRAALGMVAFCAEPAATPLVPWLGHDARFIRALCHVLHRAEAVTGERIPPVLALDAWLYEIAPLTRYQAALGDEPERLRDLAFTDLSRIRPPDAFVMRWHDDLRWHARRLATTSRALEMVAAGFGLFQQPSP